MNAPAFLIVFGGVTVVLGGLAYSGVWRSWAHGSRCAVLLCLFWLGLAITCMGVSAFCFDGPLVPLGLVLLFGVVVFGGVGVWSLLSGTPRWLQPRWCRAARSRSPRCSPGRRCSARPGGQWAPWRRTRALRDGVPRPPVGVRGDRGVDQRRC